MADEIRDLRAVAGKPYGSGPVKICCPFHTDLTPSLAIYPDNAWCFGGCGRIAPERLLAAFNRDADSLPIFEGEISQRRGKSGSKGTGGYVPPSATLVSLWHETLMRGPRKHRLDWLTDRGLTRETIKDARLGHDGLYYTIPVYNYGCISGVKRRRDSTYCDPEEPRYSMPFGQPALLYRPKPRQGQVIVCEGEFDALIVSQYGYDGVTTTAGSTHLPSLLIRHEIRGPGLLVAVDKDAAGEAAYRAILEEIDGSALRVEWESGKDITEALCSLPLKRRQAALRVWIARAKEGK